MTKGEIAKIGVEFIIGFLPDTLVKIGSAALDLASLPTNPLEDARNSAIEQTLTALEKNGEFGEETLQAAKTLLENPPPLPDLISDDTVELLRTNKFEKVLTQRLVAKIASGSQETDRLLSLIFSAAIQSCMKLDAFRQATHFDVSTATLQGTRRLEEGNAEINAKLEALLRKSEAQAEAVAVAERLHVTEKFVLALARKYAEDAPTDMEGALASLRRALEIAAEERAKGRILSNTSDAVDAVMARVDELNDEGRIEDAQTELRDAIAASAEREEAERATRLPLIDRAIAQAILANDPEGVAEWEEAKARERKENECNILHTRFLQYFQQGQNRGVRLDLEIAEAIARRVLASTRTNYEHGIWLNLRGEALRLLSERGDVGALEEAVRCYEAALKLHTRDSFEIEWAGLQHNLCLARQEIGARGNVDALFDAVGSCKAALEVRQPDANPEQWARTQNVLASAYVLLDDSGARRSIRRAIRAFKAAQTVLTRDEYPFDWAMIQSNLGTAFQRIGHQNNDKGYVQDAICAYRLALEIHTREVFPEQWGIAQKNLGVSLMTKGRLGETTAFREAIHAFAASSEVLTNAQYPLPWAGIRENIALCRALMAHSEPGLRREHLLAALSAVDEALSIYQTGAQPQFAEEANRLRDRILAAVEDLPGP